VAGGRVGGSATFWCVRECPGGYSFLLGGGSGVAGSEGGGVADEGRMGGVVWVKSRGRKARGKGQNGGRKKREIVADR
jgi:hypothetical protein